MPTIIKGNDGVHRVEIDGEIYPVSKAESIGDAPKKSFNKSNDNTSKNLISISLNKGKNNLESQDSCDTTTSLNKLDEYYQQLSNINSEDIISVKTSFDVFQHTTSLDSQILKEVLEAIIDEIENNLRKVTTFTGSDESGQLRGRCGEKITDAIRKIKTDANGDLLSVRLVLSILNISKRFSENVNKELPTSTLVKSFLSVRRNNIVHSLKEAFYQRNQNIDISYLNANEQTVMSTSMTDMTFNKNIMPEYIEVWISKPDMNTTNITDIIFGVIKNRIDWYINEGGSDYDEFIKLTRDMSDTYILIDTDFVSNESNAARCSNVKYDLPLTCEKILDNCNNIQAFLKKHYEEFFEYMMQFDMYVYLKNVPKGYYECTIYIPTLEIRKSPKWFSWFTQPALKHLRKDLRK